MANTFVLGLVQMQCSTEAAENMDKGVERILAAAKQGGADRLLAGVVLVALFLQVARY